MALLEHIAMYVVLGLLIPFVDDKWYTVSYLWSLTAVISYCTYHMLTIKWNKRNEAA